MNKVPMFEVPHPGELILEICLNQLNLSVEESACKLETPIEELSELLDGKIGISPEMALRLAKAFNTTPESWLTQQKNYDLWINNNER